MGRFLTPDPFGGSAKPGNPSSWNRYAYVENDPINRNDPTGLEISLQLHEVFGSGNCHASIRITPEDQDRWKNDPRWGEYFSQQDANGKWYLTIGAGPELLAPFTLISNLNRYYDKQPHTITSSVTRNLQMSSGENSDIETLLTSDRAYADDLNYDYVPSAEGSGYNSNSYISGLLSAAGFLSLPSKETLTEKCGSLPGWDKPVPFRKFAPEVNWNLLLPYGPRRSDESSWNPFDLLQYYFDYGRPHPSMSVAY